MRDVGLSTITQQRELVDRENRSVDFRYIQIHFAIDVAEDSQAGDFVNHKCDIIDGIAAGRTDEHEETTINFSHHFIVNLDRRSGYSLNHCTHEFALYSAISGAESHRGVHNQLWL